MADEPTPQFLRQELGARLRDLRLAKDLTVGQVAEELLCSPSKISRMENGQRGASPRDVRDLCDVYGVAEPAEREELMALAHGGRQRRAEQHDFRLVDPKYNELEATADKITVCVCSVLPALFQTEPYRRAHLPGRYPQFDAEEIEVGVEAVAARQAILTRKDPPDVLAFIDEAALHREVGGAPVMRDQLDRLDRVATLPNVELRVIPFSVGAHVAADTSFVTLEFYESAVPALVFTESLTVNTQVNRTADVKRFTAAITVLRSTALDARGTRSLISAVRDRYAG